LNAPPRTGGSPAQVGFVSLGCPEATVDSERILTQLRSEGYEIVPSYREADLVVVGGELYWVGAGEHVLWARRCE
jgi:hypothetical protein